jgi:4-amino-4-deoxy-L-arabinose transferase-like glycosyltransferase
MRYDEAYSFLRYAMGPVNFIVHTYDLPNNHPLNSLLMHATWRVFGVHTIAVRLPAFALGSLVPVAAYLAAREEYDAPTGLWAAALTAGFGPLVEFSVNGRGYAPGVFFLLLALWAGARILNGARWWPVPIFAASATLSLYSVPTMAYGIGAVGLFLGARALVRRRPDWRAALFVALAGAATVLLTLLLYRPLQGQPGWTIVPPLPDVWPAKRDIAKLTWSFWNRTTPDPLDWLVAIAFLVSPAVRGRPPGARFPLAVAGVVTVVVVAFTPRLPPFPRSYIALLPLYLVAASAGLAWLARLVAARLRARPVMADAAAVVAVAALAAAMLHAGLKGSEAPPQSDDQIVPYLERDLRASEVLMNQATFAPATNFYFLRDGYPGGRGGVTDAMHKAGHAVVIVQGDRPEEATGTVMSVGGVLGPGSPRLLRRFDYDSVWDVPVAR